MNREQMLADWLGKAKLAVWLSARGKPWPAWSTGECLAVALILDDVDGLRWLGYTRSEALERLRFDIGEPTVDTADKVFVGLRQRLHDSSR
jgi:hypothetical protein